MRRSRDNLTPLGEAKDGTLGRATLDLVSGAAQKVLHRNPDEAAELTQEFIADEKFSQRIQKASAVAGEDEQRYAHIIREAVRNFQVDRFRETPRGRRRRSYEDALRNSKAVEAVRSGRSIVAYRRVGDTGDTYDGSSEPLVDALRDQPPPKPAAWSSEKRDAPPAAPGETERLTLALLHAAGGPVAKGQVFDALDHVMRPVPVEISLEDAAAAHDEVVVRADVDGDAVAAVYDGLSDSQRLILAGLVDGDGEVRSMTGRKAEDLLGIPRSTADRAIKALCRRIEDCQRDGHDAGAMLRELVALAQDDYPNGGTTTDGSSS